MIDVYVTGSLVDQIRAIHSYNKDLTLNSVKINMKVLSVFAKETLHQPGHYLE